MAKVFTTEHIQKIVAFQNILSSIHVYDVFVGTDFIAFLVDKPVPKNAKMAIEKIINKKIYIFIKKDEPLELIKQFSPRYLKYSNNSHVEIAITKKMFYVMTWFLKRNYKNAEFKFKIVKPKLGIYPKASY